MKSMTQAKWIWLHTQDNPDEYGEFFDAFTYTGGGAYITLSCDSNYALYVNGSLAGFGQYADFPHYKVSDTIDLAPFLRGGENAIKIVVWYYGAELQVYYKNRAGLIYEVTGDNGVLAYSSEKTQCKLSDNYISGLQKVITWQLGYSFRYDAREGASPLGQAVPIGGMPATLYPRPIKSLQLSEAFFGRLIDADKRIYDLGRERVGFLHIKFKANAGEIVTIAYGEHLADGAVRRRIGSRDFSVEVVGSGVWAEYTNPFRRLGARYLQVSGDCEIERIGIKETLYPVSVLPFCADSALHQAIYDTCVRTLRLCMHEHYEDCPWREQALYTMDSRNQMLCGYYAFGEYAFARSGLKLIGEDRREDGLLSICAPSKVDLTIPSFSLYYILQMREYADYSGDGTLLQAYYGKLKQIVSVFTDRMENGLVPTFHGTKAYWNFYEWADGLEGKLGQADEKRFDLILNALLSYMLQNMALISESVGKTADGAAYKALSAALNGAITARFYDAERGLYKTFESGAHYSELGNALAVLSGAAGERAQKICGALSSGNDMVKATLSMIAFKYDALLKTDKKAYAGYILADIDKNYGYMLSCGATGFWETIKGASDFGDAGSLCHGWSAMPIYYYHILSA